jgi:hypothetical protein
MKHRPDVRSRSVGKWSSCRLRLWRGGTAFPTGMLGARAASAMKTDTQFPPPPQFNQPPLRCDEITPQRALAIRRAEKIAEKAESCVGMSLDGELPFIGTARGFALHCVSEAYLPASIVSGIAQLVGEAKLKSDTADLIDGVMLIHPREHWGILGPMRGDIVLYRDGYAAVVTKPLCMGCQHFEAVALGGEPPQIMKGTHMLAAVRWIVRAVDEAPEPQSSEPQSPEPQSPETQSRPKKKSKSHASA